MSILRKWVQKNILLTREREFNLFPQLDIVEIILETRRVVNGFKNSLISKEQLFANILFSVLNSKRKVFRPQSGA